VAAVSSGPNWTPPQLYQLKLIKYKRTWIWYDNTLRQNPQILNQTVLYSGRYKYAVRVRLLRQICKHKLTLVFTSSHPALKFLLTSLCIAHISGQKYLKATERNDERK
jgi:hypothetical protein